MNTAKSLMPPCRRYGGVRRDRSFALHIVPPQIALLFWMGMALAAPRQISAAKSILTVHVHKAGVLSGVAGHDHEITAPIASGTVDTAARTVEIGVKAAALKVADSNGSGKDQAEIQKTMLGPAVLDSERYPEILFRSKTAESLGENAWKVQGDLTLHGETRPVAVEVRESGGHYRGTVRFRQTEFGIKPVKVAGGTVRVKDEIGIDFDIQLSR
jgi:polyisoprenoid-binding protein YceI